MLLCIRCRLGSWRSRSECLWSIQLSTSRCFSVVQVTILITSLLPPSYQPHALAILLVPALVAFRSNILAQVQPYPFSVCALSPARFTSPSSSGEGCISLARQYFNFRPAAIAFVCITHFHWVRHIRTARRLAWSFANSPSRTFGDLIKNKTPCVKNLHQPPPANQALALAYNM